MTPQPLKLISVNIEGHKHLDLVLPFLREQKPDVVCLQEVYEPDFQMFAEALDMKGHFAPMTLIQLDKKTGPRLPQALNYETRSRRFWNNFGYGLREKTSEILVYIARFFSRRLAQNSSQNRLREFRKSEPWGIALLTKLSFTDMRERYYFGNRESVPVNSDNIDTIYKVLVSCIVTKDGADYCVGTTHFTWTPNGQPNENQRRDMPNFLVAAGERPEIIFCGDLNAPRGREMFGIFAEHYIDHIPPEYKTSIDGNIHREGPGLRYMVDGLFSTPHYDTRNVRLVSGVSDHCAIVAEVFRHE